MSVYIVVSWLELVINVVLSLVVLGMAVWAFATAARASAQAFEFSGRRSKNFWMLVTGACVLGALLSAASARSGSSSSFILLLVATVTGVFLADVRPAVARRR